MTGFWVLFSPGGLDRIRKRKKKKNIKIPPPNPSTMEWQGHGKLSMIQSPVVKLDQPGVNMNRAHV